MFGILKAAHVFESRLYIWILTSFLLQAKKLCLHFEFAQQGKYYSSHV